MDVQQWEFCRLEYGGWEEKHGQYKYELVVRYLYYGESGRQLASMDRDGKVMSYDPFYTAIGYLGSYGWELINVQHGLHNPYTYLSNINWSSIAAYFRRPIQPGRRIDEPTLILP